MAEKQSMAISVDEMAELLNISRPSAFTLAHSEGFPAFRVGRRLLINRAGLQSWMDEQTRR